MRSLFFIFLAVLCHQNGFSQKDSGMIYIINGSFEGLPRCCNPPEGWIDCGFKGETPPDIQPADHGQERMFGVYKQAYHGNTYLGMVARDNDTYERVAQHLSAPLRKGKCYSFSIFLTRSPVYLSAMRDDAFQTKKPFTTPLILKIYGGDGFCHQKQLLAESGPVSDTVWRKFEFEFSPKYDMSYLELEVFYKTPVLFPYNGNMLLDQASHITLIPCPQDSVAYKAYKRQRKKEETTEKQLAVKKISEKPAVAQVPAKPAETGQVRTRIMKDLTEEKIRIGHVVKIEKLFFDADSVNFRKESYPALDEIYDFLIGNPNIRIEVGGHTNGQPSHEFCDRLSTARAKAVRDYLVKKGISETRITSKGYGKRQPIASNDTKEGRNKNQRVEIKIISI